MKFHMQAMFRATIILAYVHVSFPFASPRSSFFQNPIRSKHEKTLGYVSPKVVPSAPFCGGHLLNPLESIPLSALEVPKTLLITRTARKTMMFCTAAMLYLLRKNIFFPGGSSDSSYSEPLPPGSFGGCPWVGSIGMFTGWNKFNSRLASKFGFPSIFKMYGLSSPMAVFSGSKIIKKLLQTEFKSNGNTGGRVSQLIQIGGLEEIFGSHSMSSSRDKNEYNLIRRLVGVSMTNDALKSAMPNLQKASEDSVRDIIAKPTVVMQKTCTRFTLDVAWRQILGLNLNASQLEQFHKATHDWITSLLSPLVYLPIPGIIKLTKGYKARKYLVKIIEEKLEDLEKNGPDGYSSISAMYFATDIDDVKDKSNKKGLAKKLSRDQIIDNSLLLILAGSETSANTLTNTMLLLGLHPQVWRKVKEEQNYLKKKHGTIITKAILDHECHYLDSVVKESMRLIPLSGGMARRIDETVAIDGIQIPKKWVSLYSISLTHERDPMTRLEDGSHMDIHKGFDPERWLDENRRPTSEYIPFGVGYRHCLGHMLGTIEMKTFLAVLAREIDFDLVLDEKIKNGKGNVEFREGGAMAIPKDGVVITAQASSA